MPHVQMLAISKMNTSREFPIAYAEALHNSSKLHEDTLNACLQLPVAIGQQQENLKIILGSFASKAILVSFAAEMALKSHIERLGIVPPQTHDLKELFEKIPDENFKGIIEKSFNLNSEVTLIDFLDNHKFSFIKLRYLFEQSSNSEKSLDILSINKLITLLTKEYPNG